MDIMASYSLPFSVLNIPNASKHSYKLFLSSGYINIRSKMQPPEVNKYSRDRLANIE